VRCPKCGIENPIGKKFCGDCGAALANLCPKCGADNPAGKRFCGECGAALGSAPAPSKEKPETRVADAAAFETAAAPLAHHLAEKIRQSKSVLEGERKQVTVLFADVKGSMEIAEQMDPEEWSAIMRRFFKTLAEGVERFEGYVDKFTGDGIMALFGAPIAHEDHARRACYAALHMSEGLRAYANELRLRRGLSFSVRLGLNSGEVIVGKIGDDLRMDYTAQGHTVGLASRMEQIAEPGKAYLTANTASLVEGYFTLNDLGEMEIKGVHGAMHVYELQGLGQLRTRLDVSRSRGFSRFVGRGDEMQVLESALTRAREGKAQVIGIVGAAGLGKSRLCFEFLERCRARGLMTYETTGVAHGKAIPFLPILRLFRAFFGITEQDSEITARQRIAGRLLLLDERLRESLPLVFDFMGVADPDNPAPRIDPEARQRQMFDIVRRVIQARGGSETRVTLLEDLHWFDGGSEAFLEPLIDASIDTPALTLLNYRPEYHAAWMGKSYFHQMPLAPLGPEAIRELLDALLGKDPSIARLPRMIHERSGGNPFFTEEVVQSLIESGNLQGSKGAYRLVTPVEKLEVPSSVRAILAARIDRLAQREKDVLQTAAVIGREFDEPTLAAVVEQDAPQLHEALQKLKDAEFVYEQSLYPVAEYLFKHPLTHEVALATQLEERRRRLHAAVARVIEAAHPQDLDQQAALLAHHWEEAGDVEQAMRWHRRAAEYIWTRDSIEGLRHWRKVREFSRALDTEYAKDSRLRACTTILGGGSWRLGMTDDEARELLQEARSLAHELGRPSALATALSGFAGHVGVLGHVEAALEFATEAKEMLDEGTDRGEAILREVGLGYWLFVAGRLAPALETVARVARLTSGDPEAGREVAGFSPLIWAEMITAWALSEVGRFDECWQHAERAIKMARECSAQENLAWALAAPGLMAYLAGGVSRVPGGDLRRACAEAVEIADAVGSRFSQVLASCGLGAALYLSGGYGDCEERLTETAAQARAAGTGMDHLPFDLAIFADSCRARGDLDAAISRAREGIEAADAGGAWFNSALTRAALADALVAAGAPDAEIMDVIAQARELVRKSGGNSLLPRLREAEARLAGRKDRDALVAGLREAEQLYRAMGAPDPADRLAEEIK
jgi:class 3 adenylate cyclase/tetratricopeptide (TPR) repeat protein